MKRRKELFMLSYEKLILAGLEKSDCCEGDNVAEFNGYDFCTKKIKEKQGGTYGSMKKLANVIDFYIRHHGCCICIMNYHKNEENQIFQCYKIGGLKELNQTTFIKVFVKVIL